jgi:hypothetical protein
MTKVTWTCMNVINLVTFIALKVMMVIMSYLSYFVSRIFSWQKHLLNSTLL